MTARSVSIAGSSKLLILIGILFPAIVYAKQQSDEKAFMNYLLAEQQLRQECEAYFSENHTTVFSLPEGHFNSILDSLKQGSTAILQAFISEQAIPDKAFRERAALDIRFFYDKYHLSNLYYHALTTGERKHLPRQIRTNSKYFNNASLLGLESFSNYLRAFVDLEAFFERHKRKYRSTDNQLLAATFAVIGKYFTNPAIKEYLQQHYLLNHIEKFGIKNIETFYKDFIESSGHALFVNRLKAIYDEDKKGREGHLIMTYKDFPGYRLDVHIFLPSIKSDTILLPVVLFFHGGGWAYGKPDWHFEECRTLAAKGIAGVAVEYRLADRHGTSPFEAVMDAKSVIRWLRMHAGEFGIDPDKIIASGNSAGGQVVLATALSGTWNETGDDLSISAVPDAIMVNAAVYDMTATNRRVQSILRENRIDESLLTEISPLHQTKTGHPPMLAIHGSADISVAWQTAQEFADQAKNMGNTINFHLLEGGGHFLWQGEYAEVIEEIRAAFLQSLTDK